MRITIDATSTKDLRWANVSPGAMRADYARWAAWARQQADLIDPLQNGSIAEAVAEHAVDDDCKRFSSTIALPA